MFRNTCHESAEDPMSAQWWVNSVPKGEIPHFVRNDILTIFWIEGGWKKGTVQPSLSSTLLYNQASCHSECSGAEWGISGMYNNFNQILPVQKTMRLTDATKCRRVFACLIAWAIRQTGVILCHTLSQLHRINHFFQLFAHFLVHLIKFSFIRQ